VKSDQSAEVLHHFGLGAAWWWVSVELCPTSSYSSVSYGHWCVYAFVEVEDISLNKNGDLLQERLYAVHRQVSDFKSTLEYYFCYLKMTAMVRSRRR